MTSGDYKPADRIVLAGIGLALILVPFVMLPSGYQFANLPKFLVLQIAAALVSFSALYRWVANGEAPEIPWPVLLFAALSLLQLGRSLNPDEASLLLLTLTAAIAVGFGGAGIRPDLVGAAIAVGGGLVGLVGVLESMGIGMAQLPTSGRPSATLGFRNVAANYSIGCLPFCVYLAARKPTIQRVVGHLSVLLVLLFIIYTRSRGAWVGALASLLVYTFWAFFCWKRGALVKPRKQSIVTALLVGLCVCAAATADLRFQDQSLSRLDEKKESLSSTVRLLTTPDGDRDRRSIWSHTLEMVSDHPLAGVGLGNWSAIYPAYDRGDVLHLHSAPRRPHNDFLWVVSELGILALVLFVFCLVRPVSDVFKGSDPLRIAALCAVAAVATHSLFSFPREQAASSFLLFLSLALAAGSRRISGPRWWSKVGWGAMAVLAVLGASTGWRAIHSDAAYAQALHFQRQDRVDQQLASAQESLQYGIFDHRALLLAGDALYQKLRYADAVRLYQLYMQIQPNLGAVHNNLGRALNATEDYAAAQQILEAGRDLLPNDRWMLNNLAEAYRRQGMDGEALALYGALETMTADEHHNLGLLAAEADSFQQARIHYEAALKLDPGLHEIGYSLAGIALLEKDYGKAIKGYESYLESPDPNPTLVRRTEKRLREAYSALGVQRLKAGDTESAREYLEHRRSLGDMAATDAYALAMIYGKLSMFSEAEGAARLALEQDATHLPSRLALANALHEQGRAEAIGHYRTFLENWKGDPRMAGFARSRLEQVVGAK